MYKEETQLVFQIMIGIWGTFPTISALTQIPSSSFFFFWNNSILIKANSEFVDAKGLIWALEIMLQKKFLPAVIEGDAKTCVEASGETQYRS